MKVLLTGATSLLGAATVRALQAGDHEVSVLQRRPAGLGVREVLGDITDAATVAAAVAGHDAVVHLAAKVDPVGAWSDFEAVNVNGTEHVVSACRLHDVGSLIQVSTPSVAHHGASIVGDEAGPADPTRARGQYARSKAIAEVAALEANGPDLAVVAVRPHLVWGPGDTQLIGRIVERARAGRLALVGSGLALIDTTYLDNAADAIVAALAQAPTVAGRAFVISNGEPRTVREVLERILHAAGVTTPLRSVPVRAAVGAGLVAEQLWDRLDRTDDPPMTSFLAEQLSTAHWFDQRETREALRWAPSVSLDEGFRRLSDWYAADLGV